MLQNRRFHELDSLRALAALGVVAWHYICIFHASPLPSLLAPFYKYGLILVDFFFVLSGFVLAHAYWDDRRMGAFLENLKSRVARIYPLHLFTLLLVAVLQWILIHRLTGKPFTYPANDKYHFFLNLLLLNQSGLERGLSFNAPSWSISTEFIANIIFFAVLAMPRKVAQITLPMLFGLCLGTLLSLGFFRDGLDHGVVSHFITRTMFGFLVGVGAYRFYKSRLVELQVTGHFADFTFVVLLTTALSHMAGNEHSSYYDIGLTLFIFPTILVSAVKSNYVKRVLLLRPLVYLGTISYSIYLIHFPLQLLLHTLSAALQVTLPYGEAYFLLGFLLMIIAAASASYHLIELPGKKLITSIPMPKMKANLFTLQK